MVGREAATDILTSTGLTEATPSFSRMSDLKLTPASKQLQDPRDEAQSPHLHS